MVGTVTGRIHGCIRVSDRMTSDVGLYRPDLSLFACTLEILQPLILHSRPFWTRPGLWIIQRVCLATGVEGIPASIF